MFSQQKEKKNEVFVLYYKKLYLMRIYLVRSFKRYFRLI